VDDGPVEGTVNRLRATARGLGWLGGQLQTGRLGTYVIVFLAGALVILGAFAL